MAAEKILVAFADGIEPGEYAFVQFRLRLARALRRERVVVTNPFVHLVMRRVVGLHQLVQFRLHRVVRGRDRNGDAGLLLDQIADGQRLVRGQQRAQQADGEVVHADKVAIRRAESKANCILPPHFRLLPTGTGGCISMPWAERIISNVRTANTGRASPAARMTA